MPDKQSLSEIMNDPHFCQFAALLSLAMSPKFRMSHPEVPDVRATLEYRLIKLVRGYQEGATEIRDKIIQEFSGLIRQIVETNPDKYFYRVEDYDWFLRIVEDSEIARFVLTALFAVSVSRRTFYSSEEVEAMPEHDGKTRSAVWWRQRAQAGKIVGAFKAGNTWMFPDLSLRAIGVKVPGTPIEVIKEPIPEPEEE